MYIKQYIIIKRQYDVSQYSPYLLWRRKVKERDLLSTKGLEDTYLWCICSSAYDLSEIRSKDSRVATYGKDKL